MQAPAILRIGRATHGHLGKEQYYFDDTWCLHLYSHSFTLGIDNESFQIKPGDISLIPPAKHMYYDFNSNKRYRHFYCLFQLDEEVFCNMHIRPSAEILQCCTQLFRSAIDKQHIAKNRSQIAIWEILWQLHASQFQGTVNPVVQAQHMIKSMLNQDLQVSHIAKEVNISNNQLTRLFRKELGMTVIAYIRQQRMHLAKQLIQETELPIKRIAQECGIQDLQYFNKCIRSFYNCSPRALRNG